MVARAPSGEVASWPVVESVQVGGVCAEAVAPAPDLREDRASQSRELAVQIATELGVTGVLAVELFGHLGQRAGHAPPQHWPLDSGRFGDQPV